MVCSSGTTQQVNWQRSLVRAAGFTSRWNGFVNIGRLSVSNRLRSATWWRSTVNWGTTALTTQFVSGTQLTAQVPASAFSSSRVYAVTVVTPSPGGGISNSFRFEVETAGGTPPNFTTLTAYDSPDSSAPYAVALSSSATNVSAWRLNLPSGAACSYSASSGTVTITTSPGTPSGTYQIVVVFTETLPGAATAMVFLPILLLPLLFIRRKLPTKGFWFAASHLLPLSVAAVATGCGGGGGGSTQPPLRRLTRLQVPGP